MPSTCFQNSDSLTMAISNARIKEYVINFILSCVILLCWTYTILAGIFVSERHMHTLNLEPNQRQLLDPVLGEENELQSSH